MEEEVEYQKKIKRAKKLDGNQRCRTLFRPRSKEELFSRQTVGQGCRGGSWRDNLDGRDRRSGQTLCVRKE
jgi:hypothetical protein